MNARQTLFVENYVTGMAAEPAALAAGYSPITAHSQAYRLLENVGVAAAIAEKQRIVRNRHDATLERIMREAMRIAFADIRDIADFNDDRGVRFYDAAELSDDAAKAIAEISSEAHYVPGKRKDDAGMMVEKRKVKLYDKVAALRLVAQLAGHLGPDSKTKNTYNDNRTLTVFPPGVTVDMIRALAEKRLSTEE